MKKDIILIKEIFIDKYCKVKGWNSKKLTTKQILRLNEEFNKSIKKNN